MTRRPRQRAPRRNRFKAPPVERRRHTRRRLARAAGAAGLLGLVLALGTVFVFVHDLATQSRTFAARQVAVVGNRHLGELAVRRQAGVQPGDNILAVRLGQCRRRLEAHPWIASATVRRRLPDRIELHIVEHEPLALVEMDNGRLLVDRDGRPFKRWRDGDPEGLPVIRGLAWADIPAAGHPAGKAFEAAVAAVRLWRQPDSPGAGAPPPTVTADRDAGLTLATGTPMGTVVLGFEHYRRKLDNLRRLLADFEPPPAENGWQRVDLTHLQRIVIRPGGPAADAAGPKEA